MIFLSKITLKERTSSSPTGSSNKHISTPRHTSFVSLSVFDYLDGSFKKKKKGN